MLVSLFVRPLVKCLGANGAGDVNEMLGFQRTMAIFAAASAIMFWITFATTRERVAPPPQQKTNVGEELGELFRNWPWVMLLIASVFSTTFIALQAGSTVFFFKYVAGDDGSPIFHILSLKFDRTTVFLTIGARPITRHRVSRLDRPQDRQEALRRRTERRHGALFRRVLLPACRQLQNHAGPQRDGPVLRGPRFRPHLVLYGDVADWGEWKYGRRSTGLVYSASLFAIKTGVVVSSFLLPLFLACFGYVKDAVTLAQIRSHVQELLKQYLKDPSVVIEVANYQSQPLYILGQFKNTGVFFMDRPLNVLQGIALGGGYDMPTANPKAARIIRDKKVLPVRN